MTGVSFLNHQIVLFWSYLKLLRHHIERCLIHKTSGANKKFKEISGKNKENLKMNAKIFFIYSFHKRERESEKWCCVTVIIFTSLPKWSNRRVIWIKTKLCSQNRLTRYTTILIFCWSNQGLMFNQSKCLLKPKKLYWQKRFFVWYVQF